MLRLTKKIVSIEHRLNNLDLPPDSPCLPLYLIERDLMSKLFKLACKLIYILYTLLGMVHCTILMVIDLKIDSKPFFNHP